MRKRLNDIKLYLQHGHGLTPLLDLLKEKIGDGIILSPSNISHDRFKGKLNRIKKITNNIIFDPQFFIARYQQKESFKNLLNYKFFTKKIELKDINNRNMRFKHIRKIIDFQISNGFKKVVTPSLYCEDLNENLFVININFAEESIDYIKNTDNSLEVIVSVPINGSGFNIEENRDTFLSSMTALDGASAFYLLLSPIDFDIGPL